ncbi:RNA-binding protein [bacterium]|nr:RNA-binding protein [bacterium]
MISISTRTIGLAHREAFGPPRHRRETALTPDNATADELREMFSAHWRVIATVCTDRETGSSRGFGFVEMAEGTDEAIQALNTAVFAGRALTVNEAKPREGGRPAGGNRSGYARSY